MLRHIVIMIILAILPLGAQVGSGASFPNNIYQEWLREYNSQAQTNITYHAIGSTAGIAAIRSGSVSFGGTDVPLKGRFLEKLELLQFPAVLGGLVVAVNIPGVAAGDLKLRGEVVAQIFMGKVSTWNDVQIKADNPDIDLPESQINIIFRGDGSGTTRVFTEYLCTVSDEFKREIDSGSTVRWPRGESAIGNSGVASKIAATASSIGYVGFSHAVKNGLAYCRLENRAGEFVEPAVATFTAAAANADWQAEKHFYNWFLDAEGKQAWPITTASFILLERKNKEINQRIISFYNWALSEAGKRASALHYAPLPQTLVEKLQAYWRMNDIDF
jgi:phosphate transport system substrate-binding protein